MKTREEKIQESIDYYTKEYFKQLPELNERQFKTMLKEFVKEILSYIY